MAGEKDRDKPEGGLPEGKQSEDSQPRDETGDWRKGGNGDGKETGGPVGIKVGVEPPGVVRVNFDRPIETLVLLPLEALAFCQVLLQSAIMCANAKPNTNDKSRIILPS